MAGCLPWLHMRLIQPSGQLVAEHKAPKGGCSCHGALVGCKVAQPKHLRCQHWQQGPVCTCLPDRSEQESVAGSPQPPTGQSCFECTHGLWPCKLHARWDKDASPRAQVQGAWSAVMQDRARTKDKAPCMQTMLSSSRAASAHAWLLKACGDHMGSVQAAGRLLTQQLAKAVWTLNACRCCSCGRRL